MENSIMIFLDLVAIAFVILNFVIGRTDKLNKGNSNTAYYQGKTDQMLSYISDKLDKIERKFDAYEKETDTKITNALDHHVREFHKGEVK